MLMSSLTLTASFPNQIIHYTNTIQGFPGLGFQSLHGTSNKDGQDYDHDSRYNPEEHNAHRLDAFLRTPALSGMMS